MNSMKLLFDFFPIVLFFISYKLFNIYVATVVAMITSVLQVIFFRIKNQRYEKLHLISLCLIMILGSATLILHDPWFIKWKPTVIYWLTAAAFLGSCFIGQKPLTQKMMESNINLPSQIWYKLNYAWIVFFIIMGLLNIYVAYNYNTDAWVNFKLFGGAGLTFVFILLQAIYLNQHILEKKPQQPNQGV